MPEASPVIIYIAGVDQTDYVPFESMRFEDYRHSVSTFEMTIERPTVAPLKNDEVHIIAKTNPARTIFLGYVIAVEEKKRDNGIASEYILTCADRKIRLQKSIVPYGEYDGLDSDILQDLLDNAYPDLSDIYDFSSLVNDVTDGLNFEVNDDNLLDIVDDMSDLANSEYRYEPSADGGEAIITFDSGGWGTQIGDNDFDAVGYALVGSFLIIDDVAAVGNPDNAARFRDNASLNSISNGTPIGQIQIRLGAAFLIEEIEFDYRVSGSSSIRLFEGVTGQTQAIAGTGAWFSHTFTLNAPSANANIGFESTALINTSAVNIDLRIDNIRVKSASGFPDGTGKDKLKWDTEPDLSDFDLDIGSGDEFAFDIDLELGGFDDFNSITVIGGKEEIAIDWTYHGNSFEQHLGLETEVKELAVFKNTGSDVSPTWTALSLGLWGVDTLNADGGSKEVLYSKIDHYLIFDTSDIPPNLEKAVRVTGFIYRPIRVRVENAAEGEPIFAGVLFNPDVKTSEDAAQLGFSELDKRSQIRNLDFKTHNPGLKVGQAMNVTDSARGLDETVTIQSIITTWIGASGHALYEVHCGEDEDGGASELIANNDKRSREKAAPAEIGTSTVSLLTDDLGNILTDDLDNPLYIITEV